MSEYMIFLSTRQGYQYHLTLSAALGHDPVAILTLIRELLYTLVMIIHTKSPPSKISMTRAAKVNACLFE